jgi:molybdate transport system substrate-binding protein
VLLASCGSASAGSDDGGPGSDRTVTVLAASSLTDVFEGIAADVEADHRGLDVELSFAASSTVVQQVNGGAPADVIALAGEEALVALEPGLVEDGPADFATNGLQLAVPSGNPGGVTGLESLRTPGPVLVVCAEQAPCGTATATLLQQQGLSADVASYEPNVRATLSKVTLGEADVGIVYRTDIRSAAGSVEGIEIPADQNVVNRYPIATVSGSGAADLFVEEVLSQRGQQRLADAGFGPP